MSIAQQSRRKTRLWRRNCVQNGNARPVPMISTWFRARLDIYIPRQSYTSVSDSNFKAAPIVECAIDHSSLTLWAPSFIKRCFLHARYCCRARTTVSLFKVAELLFPMGYISIDIKWFQNIGICNEYLVKDIHASFSFPCTNIVTIKSRQNSQNTFSFQISAVLNMCYFFFNGFIFYDYYKNILINKFRISVK